MKNAVTGWQDLGAEWGGTDPLEAKLFKDQWNIFGATCQPPMSGFNAYVKAHIATPGPPEIPVSPYVGKKGIR
jgi:hypothetical protein